MSSVTGLFIASLAGLATAYPGMGLPRRDPGLVNNLVNTILPASATTTSCGPAPSATWPAWHAPQAGEVRGPCPGLNSLANHGICPRNGKNYTLPVLTDCLARGLNVGPDFVLVAGSGGIGCNPNPALMYFDLDMLNRHNVVEHDASISRADASTGDDHTFNQTIWNSVLTYYNASGVATIPTAAKARYNRILVEKARDPQFSFGPTQFLFQIAETALYLSTMGDPITGNAPVNFIRSLVEQEKLPYELGWTPPTKQTNLATLVAMLGPMMAATGETLPDGVTLSQYSLRAAYSGMDVATGAVSNSATYAVSQLTGALGFRRLLPKC